MTKLDRVSDFFLVPQHINILAENNLTGLVPWTVGPLDIQMLKKPKFRFWYRVEALRASGVQIDIAPEK